MLNLTRLPDYVTIAHNMIRESGCPMVRMPGAHQGKPVQVRRCPATVTELSALSQEPGHLPRFAIPKPSSERGRDGFQEQGPPLLARAVRFLAAFTLL